MSDKLNPDKALIFRIVHVDNVPWLLQHGLPCHSAQLQHPGYKAIGNAELIVKRTTRTVPISPGGTLADYVPFYFTPYSPMMYNIHTGYGGVTQRRNEEIAIIVSSLPKLDEIGCPYVIADRHAYLQIATFTHGRSSLDVLPWNDWQARNFQRNPNDPDRFERYQAEALVHQHVPVAALLGVVVYTETVKQRIPASAGLALHAQPNWYFQ